MIDKKQEIYLNVLKEIIIKAGLEHDILSIENSTNSFSINIKSNKLIKIEVKTKDIDRVYFLGLQEHEILKKLKSVKYVFLEAADPNEINMYKDLIIKRYYDIINNYEGFGCCHLYLECSNAKKCVHKDTFFALCCYYNKNLKSGKIFYGKNANNM